MLCCTVNCESRASTLAWYGFEWKQDTTYRFIAYTVLSQSLSIFLPSALPFEGEKKPLWVQPPWLSWHCCACSWSSKCRMVPRITWHIQFDVLPISHTCAYGKYLKHILTVLTRNRLLQKRSLPSCFLRENDVCHPQAIRPAAGWVVSTPRQNADPEAGLSVLLSISIDSAWFGDHLR